jgi:hypothetical protein
VYGIVVRPSGRAGRSKEDLQSHSTNTNINALNTARYPTLTLTFIDRQNKRHPIAPPVEHGHGAGARGRVVPCIAALFPMPASSRPTSKCQLTSHNYAALSFSLAVFCLPFIHLFVIINCIVHLSSPSFDYTQPFIFPGYTDLEVPRHPTASRIIRPLASHET